MKSSFVSYFPAIALSLIFISSIGLSYTRKVSQSSYEGISTSQGSAISISLSIWLTISLYMMCYGLDLICLYSCQKLPTPSRRIGLRRNLSSLRTKSSLQAASDIYSPSGLSELSKYSFCFLRMLLTCPQFIFPLTLVCIMVLLLNSFSPNTLFSVYSTIENPIF